MQQGERIAIVGAGIVGLCTAYSLRQAGHAITLFDPNPAGSQCSSGNAGALSSRSVVPLATPGILKTAFSMLLDSRGPLHVPPYYWLQIAPWLARFVAASRPERVGAIAAALSELLRGSVQAHTQIAAELGQSELIRSTGQLHLYPDEAYYAKDQASWALKQQYGLHLEKVSRPTIEAMEPEVGPGYRVGVFLPTEGWVANPLRYAQALAARLAAMQATFVSAPIQSLQADASGWTLSDGTRRWQAQRVVVCAGAWSGPLLAAQGWKIPLESQRGYHLQLARPNLELAHQVVLADRKLFITPMETGLRLAGTVEFGSLTRPPSMKRARLLGEHARAGLPALDVDSAQTWMGHRPCLPDSMPVLGPVPSRPGLWCAFGHGHLGLTGSANTGRLIAGAMAGRPDDQRVLRPFSIERF
ncbi:FAD-binding oxidoreductase [Bordetella sp. FB-8]|uniref:NAD(P)/FAD-dependent oxidoreductase n=1 Tax=Bordetella sp. FB-8 TaxID=1159870 RepID=UPI000379649F|nr:FAD-binding oxidoreductase [Bordetella sp. FB-8]